MSRRHWICLSDRPLLHGRQTSHHEQTFQSWNRVFLAHSLKSTALYSTIKGCWREGVGQNTLFQLWNVCSCWEVCLPWSNGLSLKYIQCFLLMSRDCFPTLWRRCYFLIGPKYGAYFLLDVSFDFEGSSYFNLDIQAEGSELQVSTSLFYSLMPSFSSMPIFGVVKILLDLLDVTETVWSAPSGVPLVRRLEGPLYWVFLSALCLTSLGSLYVLYDI